jgi:hypothetical protein
LKQQAPRRFLLVRMKHIVPVERLLGEERRAFLETGRIYSRFQETKLQKGRRSAETIICAIALGFMLVIASAQGYALSDEDYVYLKATQRLERTDAPLPLLSPRERAHLHDLITDPQTANDPSARDKNVKDALALFLRHQLWDEAHPGKFWDAPGSEYR